ncbi:MAG: FecR domain-containing protein [Calothrix sp. FI2-JRJ7]|nr:FecR domain-containing protein [Calothrix sp. FI2-JRJ7]
MFRKLLPLLVISLSGVAIPVSNPANAQTPLTRAVIQDLRNLVQLMPQRQPRRRAQRSDAMTPGDGLSTGRLSLADLRFNDGSWARVGEQAVFQFLPRTRNFTLNNGTVLLLIPPGRGRTNIRTPSAAAAIRGSALFIRYDKATDTTIVGALTNSGIEVFNKDASSSQVLQAGQMMVVVKGKFQGLYDFDLRTFYDTSDLVRGLDLTRQNPNATSDPALSSVQAETSAALAKQSPISGPGTIKDPSFVKLSTTPEESTDALLIQEAEKGNNIIDNLEIQPNSNQRNNSNENSTSPTPKLPTQETSKSPTQETSKSPTQETPKPPTQETPKPPTQETPKPPTQETPKPPTQETPKPPTQETPKPPTQETPKPPTQETPKPPTQETPKPPTQETPKPPTQETPKPPTQETPKPPTQETPKPPTQETPKPPTQETPKPPTQETPKPPTQETPKPPTQETPKPPTQETPKPPTQETPKPPTQETPKPPTQETPKPPTQETPKPPTQETPKPPTQETPKPPTQETPKPPTQETPPSDSTTDPSTRPST